ncbi:MAG: hypothetical protein OEU74_05450 [Gammaproteobacteria bacterium]|nr:hypothetical protein [Gammaproteobacteria bacterium]
MNPISWLDYLPFSVIFAFTVVFVFLSILGGIRLGAIMKQPEEGEASIGSIVGASLGLLAFLLAFTFNMTANRFDQRKQLLMEDVNAIATVYRRAGMLPQPYAADARALLREYVDLRVRVVQEPDMLIDMITRSEEIQYQLWIEMEKLIAQERLSIAHSLYIQSLNQMFDIYAKRVILGLQYRIPDAIWLGLYLITAMAMVTVGYQSSLSKRRRYPVYIVLAIAFSAVIVMIADLDRATGGSVTLSHQPLIEFQQKILALP